MKFKHSFLIIGLISVLLILCNMMPVHAAAHDFNADPEHLKTCTECCGYKNWTDSAQDFYKMAYDIYNPAGSDAASSVFFILDEDSLSLEGVNEDSAFVKAQQSGGVNFWFDTVESIYDSFKSVGLLFCMLYFLLDLIDRTTKEQINIEHFLRQFIKLLLAVALINNGMLLFKAIMSLSNAAINQLSFANGSTTTQSYEVCKELAEAFDGAGKLRQTLTAIVKGIQLVGPWIAIKICDISILLLCWSRLIELGARMIFAPIGMSDVFSNGFNGAGFRYAKKLMAVILQGVFIIAILTMVGNIQASIVDNNAVGGVLGGSRIILGFTQVGLIKKSQSMANDLLGV